MSEKIFIWVSWGDIDVYPANTDEDLKNLYYTIFDCMLGYLDDSITEKVKNYIEVMEFPESKTHARYINAIEHLLKKFGVGSHEAFENGTGFDKMRKLGNQ